MSDGLPVRDGAITGAVAFLGGSALMFVFLQLIGDVVAAISSVAPVASSTLVYSLLHGWPVLSGEVSPVVLIFSLIPAAILVAAGYSVAKKTADSRVSASKRGASVAVGYCSIAVLSLVYIVIRVQSLLNDVFGSSAGATTSTAAASSSSADLLPLLLMIGFTGVVFPVAFGALGGIIAQSRGY